MSRFRLSRILLVAGGVCALAIGAAAAQVQQYAEPQSYDQNVDNAEQAPGRVARLAYLSGQVQFAPAGEDDWGSVEINRPMVIGDRLLTGDDGRAVLELGDASIRIDNGSAFDFLDLDQDNVQIELSQGTLNLAVRQLDEGANFEVDTPTVAFVASQPGIYRIDNDPSGTGSMVTVFRGAGTVYGENGVSRQVAEGTSYRFNDSALASVDETGLPQPDDFDRFCETRDANYQRYAQQQEQYVPPEMIGGDDLYQYGQWNDVPEYGNVWYPTSVPEGWAPYRYGHWAWIDPWGWTWVDDNPWGYAPFHYGRWAYVRDRWGWIPGPREVRPVYAPALVVFVGGGMAAGSTVAWFPLGPREVYVPSYRVSPAYVNRVNISNTNVNQTTVTNVYNTTIINNNNNVTTINNARYVNRNVNGAVTAVPQRSFASAQPVAQSAIRVNPQQLRAMPVTARAAVPPDRASVLGAHANTAGRVAAPPQAVVNRQVIAKTAPPPPPPSFAAREKLLAQHPGMAVPRQELAKLRPANAPESHVRVAPPARPAQPTPAPARAGQPANGRPGGNPPPANQPGANNRPGNNPPNNRPQPNQPAPNARPEPGGPPARNDRPSVQPNRPEPNQPSNARPEPGGPPARNDRPSAQPNRPEPNQPSNARPEPGGPPARNDRPPSAQPNRPTPNQPTPNARPEPNGPPARNDRPPSAQPNRSDAYPSAPNNRPESA